MTVFHHVSIQVSNLGRGKAFYGPLLEVLGMRPFGGYPDAVAYGEDTSSFWIAAPKSKAVIGGGHVCFAAPTRALVDEFCRVASDHGGAIEEPPKESFNQVFQRFYYTGLVRDPDGNRVEAATFAS